MDGDGLAESRRDGARLLNHRDNGGGLGHADNAAGLAGIGDNVASMEPGRIIHGRFLLVNKAACAASAERLGGNPDAIR